MLTPPLLPDQPIPVKEGNGKNYWRTRTVEEHDAALNGAGPRATPGFTRRRENPPNRIEERSEGGLENNENTENKNDSSPIQRCERDECAANQHR
jgi:hypothetical protein